MTSSSNSPFQTPLSALLPPAHLIEHGDSEELHDTIKRHGRQLERIRSRRPRDERPLTPKPRKPPAFVTPMAAVTVKKLPEGDEWLYELKWDGYRALLIKDGEDVQIRSRNDKDLTAMYPGIAAAGRRQKIKQIVLDGELVALGEDGRPSFQALQHRSSHEKHQIVFYAFDVLYADGQDLTAERLEVRRARLAAVVRTNAVLR